MDTEINTFRNVFVAGHFIAVNTCGAKTCLGCWLSVLTTCTQGFDMCKPALNVNEHFAHFGGSFMTRGTSYEANAMFIILINV